MPSDKKRINLTIPDNIYERLQRYKEEVGITNDATACLQLVVQQLKAHENTQLMMELLRKKSFEELQNDANIGIQTLKELAEQDKEK